MALPQALCNTSGIYAFLGNYTGIKNKKLVSSDLFTYEVTPLPRPTIQNNITYSFGEKIGKSR